MSELKKEDLIDGKLPIIARQKGAIDPAQIKLGNLKADEVAAIPCTYWSAEENKVVMAPLGQILSKDAQSLEDTIAEYQGDITLREGSYNNAITITSKHASYEYNYAPQAFEVAIPFVADATEEYHAGNLQRDAETGIWHFENQDRFFSGVAGSYSLSVNGNNVLASGDGSLSAVVGPNEETIGFGFEFKSDDFQPIDGDVVYATVRLTFGSKWSDGAQEGIKEIDTFMKQAKVDLDQYNKDSEGTITEKIDPKLDQLKQDVKDATRNIEEGNTDIAQGNEELVGSPSVKDARSARKLVIGGYNGVEAGKITVLSAEPNLAGLDKDSYAQTESQEEATSTYEKAGKEADSHKEEMFTLIELVSEHFNKADLA